MRLLLDTHIWIWRLLEPERLSSRLSKVLSDPDVQMYLSPISVWETLVLARKSRLRLEPDARQWVTQALRSSSLVMIPLTHEIAITSESLTDFGSSDPADRFLAATAVVEELVMATADRRMHDYAKFECAW